MYRLPNSTHLIQANPEPTCPPDQNHMPLLQNVPLEASLSETDATPLTLPKMGYSIPIFPIFHMLPMIQ